MKIKTQLLGVSRAIFNSPIGVPTMLRGAMVAYGPDGDGGLGLKSLGDQFELHHGEVKSRLGQADVKLKEQDARLSEVEQKLARRGVGGDAPQRETWGAQVARSDELKGIGSNWKGTTRIEVKAATLTSLTTDAAGSAGDLLVPGRPAGIIELPRRKLRVRQLFSPGETAANSIEWPKMTGRTQGAATQAEGETKGQSDFKVDLGTWPVRTIAHWILASKQMLDDVPALGSLIDSELRYGLAYVEDGQLLNGGGTGADLTGVYTTATAFAPPFTTPGSYVTEVDVLLQAIAQVDDTDWEADGMILNPLDWRRLQSLKDGDGNYLGAGPFGPEQVARLWNLPVATSKAMTQGNFLVGAFAQGAQIFDRQEATVEISTEDSDNFRRNLVTLRGEERLAFVIKHPDAFVKGTFATWVAV